MNNQNVNLNNFIIKEEKPKNTHFKLGKNEIFKGYVRREKNSFSEKREINFKHPQTIRNRRVLEKLNKEKMKKITNFHKFFD